MYKSQPFQIKSPCPTSQIAGNLRGNRDCMRNIRRVVIVIWCAVEELVVIECESRCGFVRACDGQVRVHPTIQRLEKCLITWLVIEE